MTSKRVDEALAELLETRSTLDPKDYLRQRIGILERGLESAQEERYQVEDPSTAKSAQDRARAEINSMLGDDAARPYELVLLKALDAARHNLDHYPVVRAAASARAYDGGFVGTATRPGDGAQARVTPIRDSEEVALLEAIYWMIDSPDYALPGLYDWKETDPVDHTLKRIRRVLGDRSEFLF